MVDFPATPEHRRMSRIDALLRADVSGDRKLGEALSIQAFANAKSDFSFDFRLCFVIPHVVLLNRDGSSQHSDQRQGIEVCFDTAKIRVAACLDMRTV